MKKLLLACLLLLGTSTALQAQLKSIASSTAFEEPESGSAKILLLKDGKTAYIHISTEDAINLKTYDANHKLQYDKKFQHRFGKLKNMNVAGCFELGNTLAVLISEYDDKVPVLYRLVFQTTDGKLISQEQIGTLDRMSIGKAYAIAMGGVKEPQFFVRKDPHSEHYAVALFNTFVSDRNKRIEVIHYDAQHKELARTFCTTPNNQYKYINFLDMAVIGAQQVEVLLYGFNTAASGGKEGELLINTIKSGSVAQTVIQDDNGRKSTDGIIKYHPQSNQLFVITQALASAKSKFNTRIQYYEIVRYRLDASTKKITELPGIYSEAIDTKMKQLFGKNDSYSGVLQNFYLNDDGSHTVLLEGLTFTTSSYSSGSGSTKIFLGSVAALQYDENGQIKAEALVPKSQMLNTSLMTGGSGVWAAPLYHYERDLTAQALKGGNQYKSFAYLNAKNKNYILVNDVVENEERIQQGKLTTIQGVGDCDAFYFLVQPGNVLPKRMFAFGAPQEKKQHNLALFTISDFDRGSSLYATLRLVVEGRDRKVKVVWMQAE